ncbi:hypothetical protein [Luteimonas cucumeris]|nr:hypothetical protein [Luteimonas cucumeris]
MIGDTALLGIGFPAYPQQARSGDSDAGKESTADMATPAELPPTQGNDMSNHAWDKILLFAAMAWLPAISGCAREPEQASLSTTIFNYSDEHLAGVWMNGKHVGFGEDAVKPGDVNGGGAMCCIKLTSGLREVDVKVKTVKDTYTARAQIEQPWTKYATYAIVHVLPKRKIIVEIAPGMSFPRKDLLDQRLSELGIKPEAEYPLHMMNSGPSIDLD